MRTCPLGQNYRGSKTRRMPYLYRSTSTPKSPIIIGCFAKMTCDLRHPMGLRHPVPNFLFVNSVCLVTASEKGAIGIQVSSWVCECDRSTWVCGCDKETERKCVGVLCVCVCVHICIHV